jgi:hypothetical protein
MRLTDIKNFPPILTTSHQFIHIKRMYDIASYPSWPTCNTLGTDGTAVTCSIRGKNSLPWNFPSIFERKFSHRPIINLVSGLRQDQIPPWMVHQIGLAKFETWAVKIHILIANPVSFMQLLCQTRGYSDRDRVIEDKNLPIWCHHQYTSRSYSGLFKAYRTIPLGPQTVVKQHISSITMWCKPAGRSWEHMILWQAWTRFIAYSWNFSNIRYRTNESTSVRSDRPNPAWGRVFVPG